MKGYILSLTAGALFCVILTGIVGKKGPIANIMGLLTGVFMAVVLIGPILDIRIPLPERFLADLQFSAQEAVAMGIETAETSMKERLTAYIQAEAKNLGCDLDVDLSLEESIPKQVTLMGAISPYAKSKLGSWLQKNLKIPPEYQLWIG